MSTPSEPTQKDRDAAVDSLNCPPGTSIVTACAQAIATARAEGRAEGILLGVRAGIEAAAGIMDNSDDAVRVGDAALLDYSTLSAEAIALWNAVVAPDATRLAAVVRAAKAVEAFAPFDPAHGLPEGYVWTLNELGAAVARMTPDDMALLERWEVGK